MVGNLSQSTDQLDLNALDIVLDSIAKLTTDPNTERAALYKTINKNIVACTDSLASMIVSTNPDGQKRVVGQEGWKELTPRTLGETKLLLKKVLAGSAQAGCHPLKQATAFVGKSSPKNGLEFTYLLVRTSQDATLTKQVFCDLADEVSSQIENFENLRSAAQRPESTADMTRIAQLLQNIGKSRNEKELAFNFVNDLSTVTNADRVSFVNKSGRVLAVSGVSNVSSHTSFFRSVSNIARMSVASRGCIEWQQADIIADGSRPRRGVVKAVKEMSSASGFSIPLRSKSILCGIVVLEYFDEEDDNFIERRELINKTIKFSTPVLSRAVRVNSIPAISMLDWFFNRLMVRPARSIFSLLLGLLILAACLYALFGVSRPFEISIQGVLQPQKKQSVYAPAESQVEQLHVLEGSYVEVNQILAEVDSMSVAEDLTSVQGELAESQQKLRSIVLSEYSLANDNESENQRNQIASEVERIKIRIATLESRQDFLAKKKDELKIYSPIAGQITTVDPRQRLLSRPLNRGDLMLTIANVDGPWELELDVPDNRVQYIKRAQAEIDDGKLVEVRFRLASDTRESFFGNLESLDFRAEDSVGSDTEAFVKAIVEIDEDQLGDALRIGTRVYAKIYCGERNNFYLLTYEIRNKFREWFFF